MYPDTKIGNRPGLVPLRRRVSARAAAAILCAASLTTNAWSSPMTTSPISRESSFELALSCSDALPLFTAEGERAWAKGWEPVMLSGERERGSAFRTRSPEGAATYWIVSDFDAGRGRVGYARYAEGSHIGLIDVQLSPLAAARCKVGVRYTFTLVSEAGAKQVGHLLDAHHFEAFIAEWKQEIEASLPQGAAAPPAQRQR